MSGSLLDRIAHDLLIPKDNIAYIIKSSPYRYKVFSVKKKSKAGKRIIAQPAQETKQIQYWIIKNILPYFKVHVCATAYLKGKNIYTNSICHADKPYLLKLDFKDFFPSIKSHDFIRHYNKWNFFNFNDFEVEMLTRALFRYPDTDRENNQFTSEFELSIGAPSSPYLSNTLLYEFDYHIYNFCNRKNITYTRYADDLTFSTYYKAQRKEVFDYIQHILSQINYPTLRINTDKIIFSSKANRRIVTGLILTNQGHVSIGRNKKRNISSQIHYFKLGKLSNKEIRILKGMLSFINDIEPNFIDRMRSKYGSDLISNLTK